MINKLASRFSRIASGLAGDASDEYYTLYHSFMALFLELLLRYNNGKKYKVIICPCDSLTSIFRNLVNYADMIGNPKIIYSFYPEKDWADYFDMDYEKEYGCSAEEVCIFTNPPFKGLAGNLKKIKCDYLLFGYNVTTAIDCSIFCLLTKCCKYIKNNTSFNGNADVFDEKFGSVRTCFYSNTEFLSFGEQYTGKDDKIRYNILFGKDKLIRIK